MSNREKNEIIVHSNSWENTEESWYEYNLKEAILTPEKPQEAFDFREKFDNLVFGQDEAKDAIVEALVWNVFPLNKEEWTLWAFIFTWPSWVGKTEIAQATAEIALWDRNAFRKIDCNQLNSEIAADKLIGSSYVWDSERPVLNDADLFSWSNNAINNGTIHPLIKMLGANKFSIILFDEIEKAHPKVFDTLLTLLDKWQIELNSWKWDGRHNVDYSKFTYLWNSLIIFTSNQWSEEENKNPVWFIQEKEEDKKQNYLKHLQKKFRPEFLNRITKVVPFHSLSKEAYYFKINQVSERVSKWLEKIFNVSFQLENDLKEKILWLQENESFEWEMRNIERFFHDYIERYLQYIASSWKLDVLNIGSWWWTITAFWDEDLWWVNFKIQYDESDIPSDIPSISPSTSLSVKSNQQEELLPTEQVSYLHNGSFLETLNEYIIPYLKLLKVLYLEREKYWWKHFSKSINDVKEILKNLWFPESDLSNVRKEAIATLVDSYDELFQTYQWVTLVSEDEKEYFWFNYKAVKKYIEYFLEERHWYYDKEGWALELYMAIEDNIEEIMWKELDSYQYDIIVRIIHHLLIDKYKR